MVSTPDDLLGRLSELEARLGRQEDDTALRALLGRYGFCADMGLHEEWLALWTEDGVYDIVASPATTAYAGKRLVFEGPAGLRRLIEDPAGHMNIEGRSGHLSGIDLRTHVEGDEAFGESYDLVMVRVEQGMIVWGAGINRWAFRRVEGTWMIAQRVRRALGGERLRDVFLPPGWGGPEDPWA